MENIILVKKEYEIRIRHAKNTPMAWFYVGTTRGGPLSLPMVSSCAFPGLVLCFRYFTSFLRA